MDICSENKMDNNIAIITTLYKGDNVQFAKVALDSIVSQQNVDMEKVHIYLYIDGEITAEHESLLSEYSDRIYKVFRGDVNKGLAFGLNYLLEQLEDEEFVFRMDLDDISDEKRLSTQLKYMEKHPELDLIGCFSREIDESDRVQKEKVYPVEHEQVRKAVVKCNPVLHPTMCFRLAFIRQHAIRYPNLYLTEDLGFLFSVIKSGGKVGNCPEFLFRWRKASHFFERRRNFKRALVEYQIYRDIGKEFNSSLVGLLYPTLRFVFRMLPNGLAKQVYNSKARDSLTS